MKTALVTGSRGFVGQGFVQRLLSEADRGEEGYDVTELDVASPVFHDALDYFSTRRYQFDLVVHAAAYSPNREAIDTQHDLLIRNTELDAAMFRWAVQTHQLNVIYFSSSAVYSNDVRHPTLGGRLMDMAGVPFGFTESQGWLGTPFDTYGLTKRHGEAMAISAFECGVNVTVLRPFSGYGTAQTEKFPFGAFIRRALRREDPFTIWGDANQTRDFVHIDDIVEAALAISAAKYHGPVNVCTGRATSMRELAALVIESYNAVFPTANYWPALEVDTTAPMGVRNRVGDPKLMNSWHHVRVNLAEGVERAIKELTA